MLQVSALVTPLSGPEVSERANRTAAGSDTRSAVHCPRGFDELLATLRDVNHELCDAGERLRSDETVPRGARGGLPGERTHSMSMQYADYYVVARRGFREPTRISR